MAITLIINPGSTSKKYALYKDGHEVVSLQFEETGVGSDLCEIVNGSRGKCEPVKNEDYVNSLKFSLGKFEAGNYLSSIKDISAIGVRVVAPGSKFVKHALVDEGYIKALNEATHLAPLHIPPVLEAIKEVMTLMPEAKLVAASDSAFHSTHPEHVSRYSLPKSDADNYGIKRYGYHGLSVSSVASRLQSVFGIIPKRCLVCHIGGGVSITALKDGISFDSTMGFGPMSGIMMSGRAGDLDGSALQALILCTGKSGAELHEYLNYQSGFVGIAGASDMRQILNMLNEKNQDAELAISMFKYQFSKLVGALVFGLGGLDAIVFTATASVRNPELRAVLLSPLSPLGIELDQNKNDLLINAEGRIESRSSTAMIAVMRTDELGEIDRIVSRFL